MHVSQQTRTLTRQQVREIYVSDKSSEELAIEYDTDPARIRRIWGHQTFWKDTTGLPRRTKPND